MDYRKVIQFGKGSYVLSLPKDWVIKNSLTKGSVLTLEKMPRSLVISTDLDDSPDEIKTITVNAEKKDIDQIRAEIITAYLRNYDVIDIYSKRMNHQAERIKDIFKNLAGMEILEMTSTKMSTRYLLDTKDLSPESVIRRMDNIIRGLISDSMESVNGVCTYFSIKQRDLDVNRLNFLLGRVVREALTSRRALDDNPWKMMTYIRLGRHLERVADQQKRISKHLERLQLSKKFRKEFLDLYGSIKEAYVKAMTSYYKRDDKSAMEIELSSKEKMKACNRFLSRDLKKEYRQVRKDIAEKFGDHVHEHMIMTEIITNLRSMVSDEKMIARIVMNITD
ncbi:hypothetical protein GOV09_01185 [Candidatus Woesearchaeota archaeon]|nr:hypothetical protein [Candidatus Woesearchaeota archaeon]